MFRFFVTMSCLVAASITGSLAAETIGDIEYFLPAEKQNWKVAQKLQDDKSQTIIYLPENSTKDTSPESFAVHINNLPTETINEASLEKMLQLRFPQQKINVEMLEESPSSILYE
ncbi:MAG TPA: hypothetical protein VN457_08260, partial [Chlamydiales bacterium]|nr:hypothetical protein [Chlamydiales bacterium]